LLAVGSVDVSSSLAALKLPLLYLQAREDRLVPATALKTIARLRPDVQWKTLDSAHAVLQVCPGEAARAVRSFVAGLPA
jgi:pimeloyl-ACP methyl ester carboxylesterase